MLHKIISGAATSIEIVDGYVDMSVLELLSVKAPGVAVRVITYALTPDIRVGAIAFNSQNGPLAVRGTRAFHDRFVIVDERDYYHLGASIKDAGRRGAMFSRLEETSIVDALRAEINSQWAAGADLLA